MHLHIYYNKDTFLNNLIIMQYDNSRWSPICKRANVKWHDCNNAYSSRKIYYTKTLTGTTINK